MTQLEKLAGDILFGTKCEDMQRVIETITYGGVVGVHCIIRWKEDGEICERNISISKHKSGDFDWWDKLDEDFVFNVENVPQFFSLLANLDFTMNEFDTEEQWLEEIHKYEGEGKDDYFNSREDFDIIDVIDRYFINPEDLGGPIIGTKEVVEGGVKYTCGHTDQGYVFKDMNEVKNKTHNVCYIAECDFDGESIIITDENLPKLIDLGGVCTYQSALKYTKELIESMFPEFAKKHTDLFNEFAEKITDYILQEVDWLCFGTMLNEMDLQEELEVFLQEKFTEFAKTRLEKDGDGTTYKTDDELFYKFADYFGGGYFYRHNDYTLTDWDSLIDRWEDEPNY